MNNYDLKDKASNAIKWASITEVASKLVTPITNMILARILVPEAFGVVATVNMIISFADMFTDSGFQKYIIQHEFNDKTEEKNAINVAFWSNLLVSSVLWILITIFSERIAVIVGSPRLGNVIAFSSFQLLITSFYSIQMAIYRRNFEYRLLFKIRIISILIPFIITIPLALLGFGYWSLILGSNIALLVNALILTIKSEWKPQFYYKFDILKKMLSFSIWTLIESLSIWLSTWVDVFIIGSVLGEYYLGVYKTSINTVTTLMATVTSIITPILFATLSRLQNNDDEFNKTYKKAQSIIACFVLPLGVGIFLYRNLITNILLGNRWSSAADIIGTYGIIVAIKIIFGDQCSEYYRAKGKPKISFMVQSIFIVFYIMLCNYYTYLPGEKLITICLIGRTIIILIHNIIMKVIFNISFKDTLVNNRKPIVATILMGLFSILLRLLINNIFLELFSIVLCIIFYLLVMYAIDKENIKKILMDIKLYKKNERI